VLLNLTSPLDTSVRVEVLPTGRTNDVVESITALPIPFGETKRLFCKSVDANGQTFVTLLLVNFILSSTIMLPLPLAVNCKSVSNAVIDISLPNIFILGTLKYASALGTLILLLAKVPIISVFPV